MKNTNPIKVSFLVWTALIVCAAMAQKNDPAPVEGQILMYKDLAPVSGLKITAAGKNFGPTSTVTDAKGHFKLDGLPAKGIFILKFKWNGSTYDMGAEAGAKDLRCLIKDDSFHYMKVGDQSPELGINEWVNSLPLSLAKLKGKPVLLDFWFTKCPPCVGALPNLEALSKKYEGKAVVIGVHYDDKIDAAKLKDFAAQHSVTYPLGIDRGGASGLLTDHYVTQGAPTVAVLDQNGKVVLINCTVAEADAKIAELLTGK